MLVFNGIENAIIGNSGYNYVKRDCIIAARDVINASRKSLNCFDIYYFFLCGAKNIEAAFQQAYSTSFDNWKKRYYTLVVGQFESGNFSIIHPTNNSQAVAQMAVKKPMAIVNGMDGSICAGPCGNFVPYAEPNQSNDTYICFNCR